MDNIQDTPEFKAGMQAGINAMAAMIRGKVDANELYTAHQTLTQDLALRVPTNPETYKMIGADI